MNKAHFGSIITAFLEAPRIIKPRFIVSSMWEVEHFRRTRRGNIYEWSSVGPKDPPVPNLCTDEGLNRLLDIMFHGTTQIATWYVGVFETNTTILSTHTYAVPGFTECTTSYDEATRPAYVEAAASGKITTNAANKASFTFNASKTIYGGALFGGGTDPTVKGNTAGGGVLYCASLFGAPKAVVDDDVLKITVSLTGADV
jgi:hypothetical protein